MNHRPDMPRSAEIALGLAGAIHGRRLAPGAKLGEDEIGEIYRVSRTVVRAALQQLAHQGLVEMKPNRGAFVSQPTQREAREVFEARMLLEPSLARAAASRATSEDIARLRAHMEAENTALAHDQTGEALRLSGLFHMEIAQIADQQIVAGFVEGLVMRSSLVIALYAKRSSAVCECNAHLELVEALEARDGARAQDIMDTHLADLAGALDLSERSESQPKLKEILLGSD